MQLKDMFNEESVGHLAATVQQEYPPFDVDAFLIEVFDNEWADRELKQRMRHITTALHGFLPGDYRADLEILRRVLPNLGDYGFEKMVFPDYVEMYGLDDWEASIPVLEEFTRQISAEFAIRPFIVRYQDRTMTKMLEWARHEHPGVRRLASEGSRPRLPWGIALPAFKADPGPILPILEQLKLDESESVRRSVANNLNDISKDNPQVVIDILNRWQADDALKEREEIRWITSHALRTLLKQGRPEALKLLGFPSEPEIAVHNLAVEPETIHIGDELVLTFDVESLSDKPQNLMIDYVVHLVRTRGKRTPKVFKLSKKTIQPGETLSIRKKHSFRPVTTRKYYPGQHAIEPKINGKLFTHVEFMLQPPEGD
jgi:3-methyladenine DNA glycosylase AlkC